MPEIHHGISTTESATGARAINLISTAIIGLVATASGEGLDEDVFPLNRPALITDVRTAIGKAGNDGTLKKALEAIADQCSPTIVVVRVEKGEDDAETATNVIGDTVDGQLTGMKALLVAESQIGVRPRILGTPGLDTQAVITALMPIAKELRAFVYAKPPAETIAAAIAAKPTYGDRELMLIWPDFTGWEGDAVARALGTRARIDQEVGWHKSLSNYVVNGVTGIDKDVSWNIEGKTGDAKLLNDAPITTLIRNNGFRFWGNRTCSADPKYVFEVAVRTNHVLRETIALGLQWASDQPLTPSLMKDTLESINAAFDDLKGQKKIMGALAWWDASINSATTLANGKARIRYKFTAVAPMESLDLLMEITDEFYVDFADALAQL
ncbi:phage tail sheath subtilisin-like domain-containing protein [Asticcacaulis sp. BYS171W]|uniref:Phage tail sheath subtilisin-like domain-containing protein n=1 Tax=Asticcacaulis aquaticus TaxID=2984212 RepID=A0ABT5HT97_9CAUL|nr:phage tail sheath subtilisin-like domain-containing protein [Asticcacaulis aquaticus]MDC7683269.1 phage tail sheath subtilisin-like domain-containing protein [Asticcacaulis aquaticus]